MSKTKNKIISVAKNLFREISAYKATMSDIASAAKMSRRTLYTHFKSKEELYKYVIEDEVNTINQILQKAADSKLPPERKLKLYILQHFGVIDNLVRNNRYIRYDFLFNNIRIEHLRKDIDRKEIHLLTGIVKEGKEKEIFRVSDPEIFSQNLLLMFKSLEQAFILANRKDKNSRTILEYIDLMFYGIINPAKLPNRDVS
ncbi:TetR/AcrR family transcriptional regulator [uncultured Odoribacter sp.]|uniref:TetR/AcrR family transcriptional regulator n=1 Tax=uncultured Odoribacter sp. TaxID=876416 RepID=UPI0026106AC0|nr:TetR/AcrR family transcriptional regulator [uncultured Odoribacter sp.]